MNELSVIKVGSPHALQSKLFLSTPPLDQLESPIHVVVLSGKKSPSVIPLLLVCQVDSQHAASLSRERVESPFTLIIASMHVLYIYGGLVTILTTL